MIGLEFDGVLHLSVEEQDDDNNINVLKSVKYDYKKLTPNYKIIDKIKEFDICIITKRKTAKSRKVIESFLKKYKIKIKKKNIILAGKKKIQKILKLNLESYYDCNSNILDNLKEKTNIDLYLVNPYENNIEKINDWLDNEEEYFKPKYKTVSTYSSVPLTYNYLKPQNLSIKIGYNFDGVLHKNVFQNTKGEIIPIITTKYLAYQLLPNYNIIYQIKDNYKKGNEIYIFSNRQSIKSLNTIKLFLKRTDIGLSFIRSKNIILSTNNNGYILSQYNIQSYYDANMNNIKLINTYFPNINTNYINPFKITTNIYLNNYKNAVIILFTGKKRDRILLLRDKYSKEWMLPGGKIARYDKDSFEGAKREFFEETGFILPNSEKKITHYNYYNHTIIYKIYSGKNFSNFSPTKEADFLALPKLKYILNGQFEKKVGKLKSYVKNSFNQMYFNKFIQI